MRNLIRELNAIPDYLDLAGRQAELRELPDGDGHAVVVVPRFMATNAATLLLRRFLVSKGYAASGWRRGRNRGSMQQFDTFITDVEELAERSGSPVSLVGWSLGGIASRWVGYNAPDAVRQIITLGSPFRQDPREMSMWPLYQRIGGVTRDDFTEERLSALVATPTMPTTSVVSRDDVIAPPASGFQPTTEISETIEIGGSHFALTRNPAVWRIVADRLAQPVGDWRPYEPFMATGA